jgi:ABC-type transport system involved in multi-copper enzyme maturation permease subunit
MVNEAQTATLIGRFNPYDFYYTWQTTSYTTGLPMLPALLLIILVTNEFTFRTNRQNIIDGWSRDEFVNVKMALAVIFALVSTLLVIISALLFGVMSGSEFSVNGISHVGFFFLKALSYNLLAVLISVWVRRTGFAVGIYFIYLGAENIISQLLDVWSLKLRSSNGIDLGSMGDYLPMNASDGLLTFPDNPLKAIAKTTLPTDYTYVVVAFAVAYVVLFYWLGRKKIVEKDL